MPREKVAHITVHTDHTMVVQDDLARATWLQGNYSKCRGALEQQLVQYGPWNLKAAPVSRCIVAKCLEEAPAIPLHPVSTVPNEMGVRYRIRYPKLLEQRFHTWVQSFARAMPWERILLQHGDPQAVLRAVDCRRAAGRASPDDDDVIGAAQFRWPAKRLDRA